jgi:hypothetical protein
VKERHASANCDARKRGRGPSLKERGGLDLEQERTCHHVWKGRWRSNLNQEKGRGNPDECRGKKGKGMASRNRREKVRSSARKPGKGR